MRGTGGGWSSTDGHAVGEVEEVVVVAETAGVVERAAGALAGVVVVAYVRVAARARVVRQRTQPRQRRRRGWSDSTTGCRRPPACNRPTADQVKS